MAKYIRGISQCNTLAIAFVTVMSPVAFSATVREITL